MEFSRCTRAPCPPSERRRRAAGLSKLNSETSSRTEVDVDLGGPEASDGWSQPSTSLAAPPGVIAPEIPRKEVIQPQLPLRLPCYDFTPITDPTFDGCLPCGLAHRLRVLPTFVV